MSPSVHPKPRGGEWVRHASPSPRCPLRPLAATTVPQTARDWQQQLQLQHKQKQQQQQQHIPAWAAPCVQTASVERLRSQPQQRIAASPPRAAVAPSSALSAAAPSGFSPKRQAAAARPESARGSAAVGAALRHAISMSPRPLVAVRRMASVALPGGSCGGGAEGGVSCIGCGGANNACGVCGGGSRVSSRAASPVCRGMPGRGGGVTPPFPHISVAAAAPPTAASGRATPSPTTPPTTLVGSGRATPFAVVTPVTTAPTTLPTASTLAGVRVTPLAAVVTTTPSAPASTTAPTVVATGAAGASGRAAALGTAPTMETESAQVRSAPCPLFRCPLTGRPIVTPRKLATCVAIGTYGGRGDSRGTESPGRTAGAPACASTTVGGGSCVARSGGHSNSVLPGRSRPTQVDTSLSPGLGMQFSGGWGGGCGGGSSGCSGGTCGGLGGSGTSPGALPDSNSGPVPVPVSVVALPQTVTTSSPCTTAIMRQKLATKGPPPSVLAPSTSAAGQIGVSPAAVTAVVASGTRPQAHAAGGTAPASALLPSGGTGQQTPTAPPSRAPSPWSPGRQVATPAVGAQILKVAGPSLASTTTLYLNSGSCATARSRGQIVADGSGGSVELTCAGVDRGGGSVAAGSGDATIARCHLKAETPRYSTPPSRPVIIPSSRGRSADAYDGVLRTQPAHTARQEAMGSRLLSADEVPSASIVTKEQENRICWQLPWEVGERRGYPPRRQVGARVGGGGDPRDRDPSPRIIQRSESPGQGARVGGAAASSQPPWLAATATGAAADAFGSCIASSSSASTRVSPRIVSRPLLPAAELRQGGGSAIVTVSPRVTLRPLPPGAELRQVVFRGGGGGSGSISPHRLAAAERRCGIVSAEGSPRFATRPPVAGTELGQVVLQGISSNSGTNSPIVVSQHVVPVQDWRQERFTFAISSSPTLPSSLPCAASAIAAAPTVGPPTRAVASTSKFYATTSAIAAAAAAAKTTATPGLVPLAATTTTSAASSVRFDPASLTGCVSPQALPATSPTSGGASAGVAPPVLSDAHAAANAEALLADGRRPPVSVPLAAAPTSAAVASAAAAAALVSAADALASVAADAAAASAPSTARGHFGGAAGAAAAAAAEGAAEAEAAVAVRVGGCAPADSTAGAVADGASANSDANASRERAAAAAEAAAVEAMPSDAAAIGAVPWCRTDPYEALQLETAALGGGGGGVYGGGGGPPREAPWLKRTEAQAPSAAVKRGDTSLLAEALADGRVLAAVAEKRRSMEECSEPEVESCAAAPPQSVTAALVLPIEKQKDQFLKSRQRAPPPLAIDDDNCASADGGTPGAAAAVYAEANAATSAAAAASAAAAKTTTSQRLRLMCDVPAEPEAEDVEPPVQDEPAPWQPEEPPVTPTLAPAKHQLEKKPQEEDPIQDHSPQPASPPEPQWQSQPPEQPTVAATHFDPPEKPPQAGEGFEPQEWPTQADEDFHPLEKPPQAAEDFEPLEKPPQAQGFDGFDPQHRPVPPHLTMPKSPRISLAFSASSDGLTPVSGSPLCTPTDPTMQASTLRHSSDFMRSAMDPGMEWRWRYRTELGHSPRTADQLRAFAAHRGGTVSWSEARGALTST